MISVSPISPQKKAKLAGGKDCKNTDSKPSHIPCKRGQKTKTKTKRLKMDLGICVEFICGIYLLICLSSSFVDAIKCFGNSKRGGYEPIIDFEGTEQVDDQWKACIIGILPSEVDLADQAYFVLAVGSSLINHYSNEGTNSFCPEGYAAIQEKNEALVYNFMCDERQHAVAYICKTDLCNEKGKLPSWGKMGLDSGNDMANICPSEDFKSKTGMQGKRLTRRDYVVNCYVTVDQNGILWGVAKTAKNLLPLMEPFGAEFCIIGITQGGKANEENREGSFFRQSAVTSGVLCPDGVEMLKAEEDKMRKEQREKSIKAGEGTGNTDEFSYYEVGVEVEKFECDNVFWEKAYICNFDACNVDDGCHGIPMQFTGVNSERTCTSNCDGDTA